MKKLFLVVTLFLYGCSTTNLNDPRVCAQSFTNQGSIITGELYKTHDVVYYATKKDIFMKASKYLAMNGFHVNNLDGELGLISAQQIVTFGDGKTAPLHVSVDQVGNDVHISASFYTAPGLYAATSDVKEEFCKLISSVK